MITNSNEADIRLLLKAYIATSYKKLIEENKNKFTLPQLIRYINLYSNLLDEGFFTRLNLNSNREQPRWMFLLENFNVFF